MSEIFIVERDGQLDEELSVLPPSHVEAAVGHIKSSLVDFTGNIALQARMALFDAKHGTSYRTIRNELIEQKKRQEFEERIGLIAMNRK